MSRRLHLGAVCLLALAGCSPTGPRPSPVGAPRQTPALFRDVSETWGILFRHSAGSARANYPNLLNTTGSGAALFDYDGDGLLDLYLVDGQHLSEGGNRLFHNRGGGRFEDVTAAAGMKGSPYGMACAVGDFDGDGDPDLYVLNQGPNQLFRNNGNGTFTDVARESGALAPQWSSCGAFLDAEGDGDLDLYVGQYVKFGPGSKQLCETAGVLGSCKPILYPAEPDVLLLNDGHGRFHPAPRTSGIIDTGGRALGVLVDDLDGDRRPDVFVANDGSADYLFRNLGGGRFREIGVEAGVAYAQGGRPTASMGVDCGDVDGDGIRDLAVGTFSGEATSLFRGLGKALFTYHSGPSGLISDTLPVLTFGLGFFDYDNDGDLDMAQANGHVHALLHTVDPESVYRQPRQLFENREGRFQDISRQAGAQFTAPAVGRGLAFGDLDNDGRVDLVACNNDGPAVVLRNEGAGTNHWLGVRLRHPRGDAAILGARVSVRAGRKTVVRYQRTAYSFACANDPRLHFGLGSAAGPLEVSVDWRNGQRTHRTGVAVDQYVDIGPIH